VRFPDYGGDCYSYGLLAMGSIDLIVEADLDVHDFMALVPVIEGAGGFVTDWRGAALTPTSDGRIVAAGDPRVHERALKLLALAND
jgi:inositol-phosphate phosphatase/L-galactose 1-phosphate phosphatase/histidinol-phosphatase